MLTFNLKKLSYIKGEKLVCNNNLLEKLLEHTNNNPNTISIQTSNEAWSYKKLYSEVLIWKNRIRKLNLNGPTIICLHRSPRMLAILLAMQWLEITYIPIEITTPLKRIKSIIEDSKAQAMLHDTIHAEEFIILPCNVFDIHHLINTNDEDHTIIPRESIPKSNKNAYIIYTSGSTGNPKGVSIGYKALTNFLTSIDKYIVIDKMMLGCTTIAFDISYLELYLPIWQGKTLFIANQAEHKDPEAIKQIFDKYPITTAQGTPSFWNMLYFSGWKGKKGVTLLSGGEPFSKQLINNLLSNVKEIWNLYGPTEATIWCSAKKITNQAEISVGNPLHNIEMLILDSAKKLVPIGTKGQLFISGVGLANGYYNHPRLTEEKFTTIKIGLQNKRVYNTGDIALINDSMEVEVFGRIDNQIKLHGYRIELEDIETHIQSNHGVRECVVGVHNEQLIAYICINANGDYSEDELKKQLQQELPDFMIPKRFVYLDKIPLNSSGKLDRKSLSLPNSEINTDEETHNTPLQDVIKNIWQETLNLNNINVNASFFELGGHSLSAARIVNKIKVILNKSIKISDIYLAPTIRELAELVSYAPDTSIETTNIINNIDVTSWVPLTDFQFVLWISNIFEPEVKKLNIVDRKRIQGRLNYKHLNSALQNVIKNHDVFSYQINNIFPLQKKNSPQLISWEKISLEFYTSDDMEAHLNKSLQELMLAENWSKKKSLLIARLFYLPNDQMEMQIAMPHLISDQQSIDIFFKNLSEEYIKITSDNYKKNTNHHKYFLEFAQKEYFKIQSSLKSDENFWLNYLKDAALFNFPKKYIIPCNSKNQLKHSSIFPLNEQQIQQWKEFCIQNSLSLNDLLSAAISLTLKKIFAAELEIPEKLFINTIKSSREDPIFDDVIGCFIKSHPIKLTLKNNNNLISLARSAQFSNSETAHHQYASSLIKISSIGQINTSTNRIKSFRITLFAKIYSQIFKKAHNLNLPIIQACKRLAKINSDRGFLININIWHNFFNSTKNNQICGNPCQPIPNLNKDISAINGVFEVCLMRDELNNQAHIIITANLEKSLRNNIGLALLKILSNQEQHSFAEL